jgi:homoaconitate hydratase family protein
MGETFVQKVFSRKVGKKVVPSEIVVIEPDFVLSHDNAAPISKIFRKFGVDKIKHPERLVIILDHTVPAPTEVEAGNHKLIREFVKEQNIPNFYDINTGICHQVLPEKGYALPGKIILGSDSHTTTYGAFGAFSAGIGRTEVASIWATGELWMRVPETIKIILNGDLPKGVYAKDVILHIIGEMGADGATYKAVEFTGELADKFSIASRMVFSNMAAEMGAKAGYFHPDDKTMEYIKDIAKSDYEILKSDSDAEYEKILEFNLSNLIPQIAKPHTVDNVSPIDEVEGREIHQGLIGTCTNGRLEDLEAAAKILKGRKVKEGVRCLVFAASMQEYIKALKKGIIEDFANAGCIIMNPGCGPCLGAHEGVLAPGETAISTANRNFKGRMGSREAFVYLGSPATVAASVLEGKITDPRKYL